MIAIETTDEQREHEYRVVLGTGEAVYEPILGEPTLNLVAGAQGGFHVWASFLAYGFEDERLEMVLKSSVVDIPSSSLAMRAELPTKTVTDEAGAPARSFAGWPAQLDRARCANGKRVKLEIELRDSQGNSASDIRYCQVHLAERYRSQNCE